MNPKASRPHADSVAVCPVGLEQVCGSELVALGYKIGSPTAGLVPFRGSTRAVYESNLWLRTATRIIVRLARFRATDFDHLERRMAEVDLTPYLGAGVAPRFRVTTRKSALFHSDAVSERLHKVVGAPKASDTDPEQLFIIRVDHDTVTVSIDTSGEPLHKRSWRTQTVEASLRPTLAAGAVLLSSWDRSTPVVDPFAGAGTMVIEAGLIAMDRPPSEGRDYAFHRWPSFEGGTWGSVTGAAQTRIEAAPATGLLEAFDRNPAAVAVITANAKRAGVTLTAEARPVGQLTGWAGPGLVISNPPYGKRSATGAKGSSALFRRFGEVVRDRRPQSALTVVAPRGTRDIDARLKTVAKVNNGGIDVQIRCAVPSGDLPPASTVSAAKL
ncbi:MAG: hypothetical protein HKN03_16295 [Acidimicrobiales bacterium]|nr:hypothetical protein [Acidimicrobiales bacterium]